MKKKQSKEATVAAPAAAVITHEALEQACHVLRHICSLASAAMGVSRDQIQAGEDADGLHIRLEMVKLLVDRMGWAADVALRKLGDPGSFARAEDWMMPEA